MDSASRGANGDNRDQARATVAFVQVGQGAIFRAIQNPVSSRDASPCLAFYRVVKNLAGLYTYMVVHAAFVTWNVQLLTVAKPRLSSYLYYCPVLCYMRCCSNLTSLDRSDEIIMHAFCNVTLYLFTPKQQSQDLPPSLRNPCHGSAGEWYPKQKKPANCH